MLRGSLAILFAKGPTHSLVDRGREQPFPDCFGDRFHLFGWYRLDVTTVDKFSMSILGESWDEVDVGVGDAHSRNVGGDPFCFHSLLQSLRDSGNSLKVSSGLGDIPDPAIVQLRDDQRMSRIHRPNIEESDVVLVFENRVGGEFFSDDLAEGAVLHPVSRLNLL